jgi:DNA-binding MarR family transcriptional regulator
MAIISTADYHSLAELRYQIRKFLRFSEQAAHAARIEPTQHQSLLALKGLPENVRPTIGVLAERLQIRPHSAVELTNRLVKGGFVRRQRGLGDGDGREVLLQLTVKGENVLRELSQHHKTELQQAGPALRAALEAVLEPRKRSQTKSAPNRHSPRKKGMTNAR